MRDFLSVFVSNNEVLARRHAIVRNIPAYSIQSGELIGRLNVIVSEQTTTFRAIVAFAMHRADEFLNRDGDVRYHLLSSV